MAGGCAGTVAHLTACTSQAFIFLFIFPISAADAGDIKLPPTTYLFQDAFKTVHVNHCGVGFFFFVMTDLEPEFSACCIILLQ